MTEREQFFIRLWETWGKNVGIRGHNTIFFPLSLSIFNCHAKKEYKNPTGGKYMIFFPPVFLFFPLRPRPCNNCSTFSFHSRYTGKNMARGKIKPYFSR
jgi:hypothetical protein